MSDKKKMEDLGTPSENYTVPVLGENTVEVTAEITNGNAVINEISKSDIDRIVDSGSGSKSGDESIPITIDVSQAKSEVYSVELSGKTMERLTEDHLIELGWNYEGVAWNAPEKSEIPVYRLYNPNAGDHHYTADVKERDFLIKEGWNDEGIGCYSEESETVALFRLYYPNALDAGAHHFTADAAERDHLIEIGWRDEKTGWYGALRMAAVHFK